MWNETVIFPVMTETKKVKLWKQVPGAYLNPGPLNYASSVLPNLDRDADGTEGNLHDQLRKY
jgi:hypothetical protein